MWPLQVAKPRCEWCSSRCKMLQAPSRTAVNLGGVWGLQYWGGERDLLLGCFSDCILRYLGRLADLSKQQFVQQPWLAGAGDHPCFLTVWRPVASGIPHVLHPILNADFRPVCRVVRAGYRSGRAKPGIVAAHPWGGLISPLGTFTPEHGLWLSLDLKISLSTGIGNPHSP